MARPLRFRLGDQDFAAEPVRIDRSKLYGRVEAVAVDKYGDPLEKAVLDEDGATIVRATGTGYLGAEGRWSARGDLLAVDEHGRPRPLLPSSFDETIELWPEGSVDLDEYFLHEIDHLYVLEGLDSGPVAALLEAEGRLFSFPFLFRAGYESYRAFLVPKGERVFLAVGRRAVVDFIGKQNSSVIDEVLDEETADDENEELDFSMRY